MRFEHRKKSWLLLLGGLLPLASAAHHSTPEDPTPVTIEGVISGVVWRNPHIQFEILETTQEGVTQEWTLEQPSAIAANNANISRELFVIGAPVRVYGPTIRNEERGMIGWNMLFLDSNLEVILVPSRSPGPLWSERTVGSNSGDLFSVSGPLPDRRDSLYRVWTWNPLPVFWMLRDPDYFPLNQQARENQGNWDASDPSDNLVLRCIPPGMPAAMGNPHPMELINLGDVIEIRMEEFDQIRELHMGRVEDPESVERSPLGYSVGRWEDDVLVVETSRLEAGYLTRNGVPMSQDARIEERFSLDAPNGQLKYTLQVTDPNYLTEPFVQELIWSWHEGTTLQRYDCLSPQY